MGWNDQAQDRYRWKALVNVVTNLWVTYNAESFLRSWGTVGFWRRILPQLATVSEQKTNILPEDGTNKQKYTMGMKKWKNFSHILRVTEHLRTHQDTHIPANYNVLVLSHVDQRLW